MDDGPDYYDVGWMREGPGGGDSSGGEGEDSLVLVGCIVYIAFLCLCAGAIGPAILVLVIPGIIAFIIYKASKHSKEKKENEKQTALKKMRMENAVLAKELNAKFSYDLKTVFEKLSLEMSETDREDFKKFLFNATSVNDFDSLVKAEAEKSIKKYREKGISSTQEYGNDNKRYFLSVYGNDIVDLLEKEKYLYKLKIKWQSEYEKDPFCNASPTMQVDCLREARNHISLFGIKDSDEKWLNYPKEKWKKDGSSFWLGILREHWLPFKIYDPKILERAKNDFLTLGPEKATEIWLDYPKKWESERNNFLSKLEADLRKDMAESAYWANFPQDKRERQISRYLKEAQLDFKNFGVKKASELWLGFIKRSDEERAGSSSHS